MKDVNQVSGKGILDIEWQDGKAVFTVITKDSEIPYDFFEILERFNKKTVSFSIKEENEIQPLEV